MFRANDISPVRKGCQLFAPTQPWSCCQAWGRRRRWWETRRSLAPSRYSLLSHLPPGKSWRCAGGEVWVWGCFRREQGQKQWGEKRKVQEWYRIEQAVQQAVVHGHCISTVSVLSVPSLQNSRGIVTWERGAGAGWKGSRAGASCAGGSAGLSLASRKHSDLRETLLRSPKQGGLLRAELRECAASLGLAKCFFLESLGLGVGEKGGRGIPAWDREAQGAQVSSRAWDSAVVCQLKREGSGKCPVGMLLEPGAPSCAGVPPRMGAR